MTTAAALPDLALSRRVFVVALGGAVGGLVLGLRLAPTAEAQGQPASPFAPIHFVKIGKDGVVTIVCSRSEMGQGIRSSLPFVLADELGADFARVTIVQGDADARYGDQNTDGSHSVRDFYDVMRVAGATARSMLTSAAAARWGVPAARLIVHDHAVHDPATGKMAGFGELAEAAAALPVPDPKSVKLRPDSELVRSKGHLPLIDGPAFVTGKAHYGADTRLPGMLTAVILRPPVVGGRVKRVADSKALAVPGVRKVVQLPDWKAPAGFQPLGGVAVVADHTWAALQGRKALVVEWEDGPNASYDSDVYRQSLRAAVNAPGTVIRQVGDVDAALAGASKVVSAEYHLAHLVHTPMEPPAAVARVDAKSCEVWAPTQDPQTAQKELAQALSLEPAQVTVHVTFLGGGFGRKSKPDFILEAALLSRAVGAPVRVQWTREDDIRHGYYHATGAYRIEAGLDGEQKLVAWRQRVAAPSIGSTFDLKSDRLSGWELQTLNDLPLSAAAVRIESCAAPAHVRIGWMRSVYDINHCFAAQSFIGELAAATGRDPKAVLLDVLGPARKLTAQEVGMKELMNAPDGYTPDVGRLRHVIERVAELSGWDAARRAGRAVGIAGYRGFLTYVAAVVAVSYDAKKQLRVDDVWLVADPGKVANADRVRSQLEGAVVFGLSLALYGKITAKAGAIEQANFDSYPLLRIFEAPRTHIELVASQAPHAGAGEPGVPPIAPALGNAIFALTGKRLREMPFITASSARA
jgi:isoquinoline 1-oxidoreductase beta subunit